MDRFWNFAIDTLGFEPPRFKPNPCPGLAADTTPNLVLLTRHRSLWIGAENKKNVRGEMIASDSMSTISISPIVNEVEIPDVGVHELAHAFAYRIHGKAKAHLIPRLEEAFTTWAEWRMGSDTVWRLALPWEEPKGTGFFSVSPVSSHPWWILLSCLPDSSVAKLFKACIRNCGVDSLENALRPHELDSAFLRLENTLKNGRWSAKAIRGNGVCAVPPPWRTPPKGARPLPEMERPLFSIHPVTSCSTKKDTTIVSCVKTKRWGALALSLRK